MKKKILAKDLRAGDKLPASGEMVLSVHCSGIVNNKKVHLTLKNIARNTTRIATWGRYTSITVESP